jgi:hypothetical protein
MTELQQLPVSNPSFSSLRKDNQLYVDKTALIYELARYSNRQYLLARPRRFGKTLLVSTLESLFRDGLKMFHGLAIEKLWKDSGTYKVLHLDFSMTQPDSAESFEKSAVTMFLRAASDCCLIDRSSLPQDFPGLADVTDAVCRKSQDTSLVLLIDEYDSPLSANLNNPDVFESIQSKMRSFFAAVKSYAGKFRLVFITGVSRFRHISVFSAGFNIIDLSLDPAFGEIVGYTEEEIRSYFKGYLIRSAALLNRIPESGVTDQQINALMDELRRHYDGYCFDSKNRTHVYQTWSVLRFFNSSGIPEFADYWYDNGGITAILVNYFRSHGGYFHQPDEMTYSLDDFSSAASLSDMDPGVLLTQCGYYTIKEADDDSITVGIPNAELQHAQVRLIREEIFDIKRLRTANAKKTILSKKEITAAECADFFNKIFSAVSSENKVTDEYQACDFIKVYCIGSGLDVRREYHQKKGRADITVEFADHRLIAEMKFARDGSSPERLLSAAEQQILDRDYGNYVPAKPLVRFAMVFSEEEQKIILWSGVK